MYPEGNTTINGKAIPWFSKVKIIATGPNTDPSRLGKEGLLNREPAPIYTIGNEPCHYSRWSLIEIDNNYNIINNKIKIYDADTIEVIKEDARDDWKKLAEKIVSEG